MSKIDRRAFLVRAGASGAALWGMGWLAGCSSPPSRREVLAALVRDVVVPDANALSSESSRLKVSTAAFTRTPNEASLRDVQAQWRRTLLAWKKGYAFRAGPIVESNAILRTMFWPVRTREIESLLSGQRAIDENLIEELGVDLKGLYAMEHLLFDGLEEGQGPLARFQGAGAARASEYAMALASNIDGYADQTMAGIADGSLFAQSFAENTESNLGLLVNQMVSTTETVAAQRIGFAIELLKNKRLAPESLEGGKSGSSTEIAKVLIATTQRFYAGVNGIGLGALTKQASEAIDTRVSAAFHGALAALEQLKTPLEQAALTNPQGLETAAAAARELEISLKTDLASALGVLLTFSLGDGD